MVGKIGRVEGICYTVLALGAGVGLIIGSIALASHINAPAIDPVKRFGWHVIRECTIDGVIGIEFASLLVLGGVAIALAVRIYKIRKNTVQTENLKRVIERESLSIETPRLSQAATPLSSRLQTPAPSRPATPYDGSQSGFPD